MRAGLPFTTPAGHPFNSLPLPHLAWSLHRTRAVVERPFRFVWAGGHMPRQPEPWAALLAELCPAGYDETPGPKRQLRAATDGAIDRGVLGVTTATAGGPPFWGYDGTDLLFDYFRDSGLLDTAAMRRTAEAPVVAARPSRPKRASRRGGQPVRADRVRVIRASEYRRMRWKNGLGETAEIAIAPEGAVLERFDWRVSMARIEAAGPFSAFPGVDRTLTVLDGAGFRLTVDGHPAKELTPGSAPFRFPGDRAAAATLLAGAVTDLNVMTRRDRLWHRVRRLETGAQQSLVTSGTVALLVCAAASVRVTAAGTAADLGALDTLLIDQSGVALEFSSAAPGRLLLIEIGSR